jgi:hypothetical protein
MAHVPALAVAEKTPGETSWWQSPYIRTYPGGEGVEGGTNGNSGTNRVAPAQSFTFILVGRSQTDQSLRQSDLLTEDFVTLHATGIQAVGGRHHGQRAVFLGGLGKLDRCSPHLESVVAPLVSILAWVLRCHLGRDLGGLAGHCDDLRQIGGGLLSRVSGNDV